MLESLTVWLNGLEEAGKLWKLWKPVSRLLRRRRRIQVKVAGFHYFPDRMVLNMTFGTLGGRFKDVSQVDAILVVGSDFYHARNNLHVIKRLILPDPESNSFKFYIGSVSQADAIGALIRDVTKIAKENQTSVKWSSEFIFHTMLLADTDRPTGWVHIESVLPHSHPKLRPSYTVEKRFSADAVYEARDIFNHLWDASRPQ